jgi:hypothetical protein
MQSDEKACGNCRFYVPQYHGVGSCTREKVAGAMFWSPSDKYMNVLVIHCCKQHEAQPNIDKEII